jgi:hypothetical protein
LRGSHNAIAWALGAAFALAAPDALAKDVAGMFLGAFILAGGVVGFFAGHSSATCRSCFSC